MSKYGSSEHLLPDDKLGSIFVIVDVNDTPKQTEIDSVYFQCVVVHRLQKCRRVQIRYRELVPSSWPRTKQ